MGVLNQSKNCAVESAWSSCLPLNGPEIEAILNDLYASEIKASISWISDGGFHVTLGAPQIEEYALPTIRDAVLWLRDRPFSISRIATSLGSTAASFDSQTSWPPGAPPFGRWSSRRLIILQRWHRLAYCLRSDHRADLFEHPNARRERKPIAVNDTVQLAEQGSFSFVCRRRPEWGARTSRLPRCVGAADQVMTRAQGSEKAHRQGSLECAIVLPAVK
jgi:hypothetical protein